MVDAKKAGSSRSKNKNDEDAVSSEGSSNSRANTSREETVGNPTIKDLASAILQLEQSLEPKFLKRPLGGIYSSHGLFRKT